MVSFRVYFARKLGKAIFFISIISILSFLYYDFQTDTGMEIYIDRSALDYHAIMWQEYHMDESYVSRYFLFLKDIVTGDFGVLIWRSDYPVTYEIIKYIPITLQLIFISALIIVLLGTLIGILSVHVGNKILRGFLSAFISLSISTPIFWSALLLQFIFFYRFLMWGLPNLPLEYPDSPIHIILPSFAIASGGIGVMARIIKDRMIDIMNQDYIKTARLKGVSKVMILTKHTLLNMFIHPIRNGQSIFLALVVGVIIIEPILKLNGLGYYTLLAFLSDDDEAMAFLLFFFATAYLTLVLAWDILRYCLDPRIRHPSANEASVE